MQQMAISNRRVTCLIIVRMSNKSLPASDETDAGVADSASVLLLLCGILRVSTIPRTSLIFGSEDSINRDRQSKRGVCKGERLEGNFRIDPIPASAAIS